MQLKSHHVLSEVTEMPETRFKTLTEEYRGFARKAGVEVRPYVSDELPFFRRLERLEKMKILHALESSVKVCRLTEAQGGIMSDSPALLWTFLREFGLRPPSDLFSHITGDSVVEIHSVEGNQIFRNFNFYRYCSYTLEDLYCRPWPSLFDRDPAVTAGIIDFVTQVFSGTWTKTQPFNVPIHSVRELFSEGENEVSLHMQQGAPLFESGTQIPRATIAIEKLIFQSSKLQPFNLSSGLLLPENNVVPNFGEHGSIESRRDL